MPFAYDAVLFDMDGTLVDTVSLGESTFARVCHEQGVAYDVDGFHQVWSRSITIDVPEYCESIVDDGQALSDVFFIAYRQSLSVAPALAGADELLKYLHGRVPLGLVTGADRPQMESILRARGWTDYFSVALSFPDYGIAKPDPIGYVMAAQQLGVIPERCIAFEDTHTGLVSAKRAGMTAVGITVGNPTQSLAEAHHRYDSLATFHQTLL